MTRNRIGLVLAALGAACLLAASNVASAAPSHSAPASVYCDYANHVPAATDR